MLKQKRGDSAFIVLILVLVSIAILVTIVNSNVDFTEIDKPKWEKVNTVEKYDNVPEEDKSNIITNTQNGESGTSKNGGGNSNGGGSNQEESSCTTKLVKYSLRTITLKETCNELNGEICVKKSIVCSTKIQNDDTVTGVFDMELLFVKYGTSKELNLKKQTAKYIIESSQSVVMEGTLNVSSQGEDGIANQKINCFFNTVNEVLDQSCT